MILLVHKAFFVFQKRKNIDIERLIEDEAKELFNGIAFRRHPISKEKIDRTWEELKNRINKSDKKGK